MFTINYISKTLTAIQDWFSTLMLNRFIKAIYVNVTSLRHDTYKFTNACILLRLIECNRTLVLVLYLSNICHSFIDTVNNVI